MATATKRKARTIRPYHRKFDGWYYANSIRFVPLFGKKSIKLIKGPKNTATEQLAIVELQNVLQRIESDTLQDDMSIGVLAEKYLEWLKGEFPKQYDSVKRYLAHPEYGFVVYFGNLTVVEFNDLAWSKMDSWIRSNSPDGDGSGNWESANSKRIAISAIKAMFNWGEQYLKQSKPGLYKYPCPEAEPRVTYFTDEQEQAIFDAMNHKRFTDQGEFADFFTILIETGARTFIEAASFTVENLEWKDGQPDCFDMGIVKRKRRVIFLTPKAKKIVSRLVEKWGSGHIFRNAEGQPWSKTAVQRRFKAIRKWLIKTQPKLNLNAKHVPYSARHTFIVRHLKEGKPVALVAEMAGNTIAILEKHYKKWGSQADCIRKALA